MFDDIALVTAEAQEASDEELLADTCKVTRSDPNGTPVWDPATGETSTPAIIVFDALPCRLREGAKDNRADIAGEHQFQQGDATLRLSATYASTDPGSGVGGTLRIGDIVTFTSSKQGVSLASTWTVIWPISGSHLSAARFIVRAVM